MAGVNKFFQSQLGFIACRKEPEWLCCDTNHGKKQNTRKCANEFPVFRGEIVRVGLVGERYY